jgi:hypothetical protein
VLWIRMTVAIPVVDHPEQTAPLTNGQYFCAENGVPPSILDTLDRIGNLLSRRLNVMMDLSTVIGILLAGLFGILGTAIGSILTGRNQDILTRELLEEQRKREDTAYKRQLDSARHDRLTKRYEELIVAAQKYAEVAYSMYSDALAPYILEEDELADLPGNPKKVYRDFYMASEKERTEFQRVMSLVAIEGENSDIVQCGRAFEKAFRELLEALAAGSSDAVLDQHEEVVKAYDALSSAVRTHMQELGTPG